MRGGAVLCVLLLSLAWLSLAWGAEGGEEDGEVVGGEEEEEDEEDEVLSDELKEEDGVLVLHEHNFARALREHRLLLVEFYAPWCGHCRRLAPEFARAAALLRNGSEVGRLGKVDAVAQTALSTEFHIDAFPTLKLFRDGNRTHPVAYSGRMDAEGMVLWMQRRAGPSATLLHDVDTAAAFISAQDVAVVGFFKDLHGEAARAFHEVAAEMEDLVFGVAEEDELFEAYGLSADTVCLFKKFDEGRTDFPVDPEQGLDAAKLTRQLVVHSLKLVMDYSNETSSQIFGAKIPHHMLLFLNTSVAEQQALRDEFRVAASTFRGEVLFVVVDVNGYGAAVLSFFGLTPSDAPTLRCIKMENNRKYRMEVDAFSATAVRDFVQEVLDGKVKPQLLSAEPPEDWNTRPVKVLVGKTFEQMHHGVPTARRWRLPGRSWVSATRTTRTLSLPRWMPRPTSWRTSASADTQHCTTSLLGRAGRWSNIGAPETWRPSPSSWKMEGSCRRSHPQCPRPRRTAQSHRAHLAQLKPGRSCEPCPAAASIINDPGNDVGSVCVCRVQFSPCWGGTQHRMVPAGPLGDTVQLVGVTMGVEPSGVCRAEPVPWAARPQAPMALSIPMEGVLPLPPCDAGPNTAWARCDVCPPDPAVRALQAALVLPQAWG